MSTYIFNKSLQEQHVPEIFKDVEVIPVPKSSSINTLMKLDHCLHINLNEKLVRAEILRKLNINLTLCSLLIPHIEEDRMPL